MLSGLTGHSFVPVGVNNALRGVMCARMSCSFFLLSIQRSCSREPVVLGVAVSSFASLSLDAQTCSLTEYSFELDAVVIIVNVVGEALDGDLSMTFHSCHSSKIDECMSCTGYRNCLTVHAKSLTRELVTLRCVLDGHVQVPHLTNAKQDRYSALFKHVDVGAAWRCRMIPEVQGPVYLGCLSICKSELE